MLRPLNAFAVWFAALLLVLATTAAEANPQKKGGGHGFGLSLTIAIPSIGSPSKSSSSAKSKAKTSSTKSKKKPAVAAKKKPAVAAKKKPAVAAKKKPAAPATKKQPQETVVAKAPRSGVPPKGETRFLEDEVLFELEPDAAAGALAGVVQAQNLERIGEADIGLLANTVHRYRITDGRGVAEVVAALEADPRIAFAQPDYVYELTEEATTVSLAPSAPSLQYANDKLKVREAHLKSQGNGIVVAVIDSRIDVSHAALMGSIAGLFEAVDVPAAEPHAHGTAMAGAIAAHAELTGIAPGSSILAVEAFTRDREGRMVGLSYHLLRGIDWAHSRGSRLFNLSFAGPRDPALIRTMAAARETGSIFIAAAGNGGVKSPPLYPAADENAIAVTALDEDDAPFELANRGKYIALGAPGVDILVIAPGGAGDLMSGTSIAAAHLTGVAALALEKAAGLDSPAIRELLRASAHKLEAPPALVGAGLADALAAVETAQELVPAENAAESQGD